MCKEATRMEVSEPSMRVVFVEVRIQEKDWGV